VPRDDIAGRRRSKAAPNVWLENKFVFRRTHDVDSFLTD
jgi:hypothetical protein